jgi:hypothetical protein
MKILEVGEKLHIITRRTFENDLRRHFVGEVKACNDLVARVEGYAFIFDNIKNEYVKREEIRIRIVGLADPGIIIKVIPPSVRIEEVHYAKSMTNHLIATDGKAFNLDINEFGVMR